jgi:hypothetical protein
VDPLLSLTPLAAHVEHAGLVSSAQVPRRTTYWMLREPIANLVS